LLRSASPIPSIVFLHPVCDIVNRSSAKDRFCFTKWIVPKNAAHFHKVIRVRKHSKLQHHVDLGTGLVRRFNGKGCSKQTRLLDGIC
jgi:uncharacterized protein VirK/YbjX